MDNWTKIISIYGCMFSGKTGVMFRIIHDAKRADKNYIIFKSSRDTRHTEPIVYSREYDKKESALVVDPNTMMIIGAPEEMKKFIDQGMEVVASNFDLICFEEGQFWELKLLSTISNLRRYRKRIVITGLDIDYQGHPFRPMVDFIAFSDQKIEVTATCQKCKGMNGEATRTQKLIDGKPEKKYSENVIFPGGLKTGEDYEPRCRECFEPPIGMKSLY